MASMLWDSRARVRAVGGVGPCLRFRSDVPFSNGDAWRARLARPGIEPAVVIREFFTHLRGLRDRLSPKRASEGSSTEIVQSVGVVLPVTRGTR